METGDVWLNLIVLAQFALFGFAILYLPMGAFILAVKGARISWRNVLLGAERILVRSSPLRGA